MRKCSVVLVAVLALLVCIPLRTRCDACILARSSLVNTTICDSLTESVEHLSSAF